MSSTKKRKVYLGLIISGVILFFLSMLTFIVLAVLKSDNITSSVLTFAWILFALIVLSSLISLIGAVLYINLNKDNIKEYLKKISK